MAMNVAAAARLPKGEPRGFSGLFRSYVSDLKGWMVGRAAGYGIAAALLVGGMLAIFAAIVVAAIALFHFLELRYGTNTAFAALGGGLLALGVILLLSGWLMIGRKAAPLPRPHRQFRAARNMLLGSTVARAVTTLHRSEAARPDTMTQVLLGAAAVLAAGWIVTTRIGSNKAPPASKARR
jgi:hypothetical protein